MQRNDLKLNDLPPEMTMQILSYLPSNDLAHFAQTSKENYAFTSETTKGKLMQAANHLQPSTNKLMAFFARPIPAISTSASALLAYNYAIVTTSDTHSLLNAIGANAAFHAIVAGSAGLSIAAGMNILVNITDNSNYGRYAFPLGIAAGGGCGIAVTAIGCYVASFTGVNIPVAIASASILSLTTFGLFRNSAQIDEECKNTNRKRDKMRQNAKHLAPQEEFKEEQQHPARP